MSSHAKDGKLLDEIVAIASKFCNLADQKITTSQVGRPPQVPFWVVGTMIVVGVLLRKRSKSAQYAWWLSHKGCYRRWFDGIPFPGRSTFFDRYRKAAKRYEIVIEEHAAMAIAKGWGDAECVSVDKSLGSFTCHPPICFAYTDAKTRKFERSTLAGRGNASKRRR